MGLKNLEDQENVSLFFTKATMIKVIIIGLIYAIVLYGYITTIFLDGSITSLPDEIVNLIHLRELYIHGLKLENLSDDIKKFLANLKGFESFEEQGIGFGLKDLKA